MSTSSLFLDFRKRNTHLISSPLMTPSTDLTAGIDSPLSQSNGFLKIRDLTKTYKGDVKALDGINLDVEKGEVVGLIGPNGAGKTTLIGCILGLLRPDSGSVLIDGKSPNSLSIKAMTGYVPERPEFEYWMNGRQFLIYHHGLSNRDPRRVQADVDEALELVELQQSSWHRRLKTYSRGMLQRLNLAQLVLGKPQLMLLDEPTLGLDPTGLHVVRKLVDSARAAGATVIINSHQLDEVERLCDRVAFMKKGRIGALETIKVSDGCDYILEIKWASGNSPEEIEASVTQACQTTGARVADLEERGARFVVRNKRAAADLLKELIIAGLSIDEAIPERTRLEHYFVSDESTDSGKS